MRQLTVFVILFLFHQYQSFHVFGVLLLIKPETFSVHASISKGWVCRMFILRVLQNCVMKQKSLDPLLQHFVDLHTMTLLSVGGVATCIMPTDLQHHRTL